MSGLSGGAFTVVASTLGVDGKAQRDLWKQIIAECIRLDAGCIGRLNAVVEVSAAGSKVPKACWPLQTKGCSLPGHCQHGLLKRVLQSYQSEVLLGRFHLDRLTAGVW